MKITSFNYENQTEKAIGTAVASGRLPHAVIIEGGSVQQRMDLGKKIAAALVCSSGGLDVPCGSCPNCVKSAADSHADVLVYSVEDKPRAFKVDMVRDIRSNAYIIPNEADKKVFILENAHTMGLESQNAILKILEEPPSFVNFIMLCSSKSVFLPTVLSRATVYSLGEAELSADDGQPREEIIEAASAVAKAVCSLNDIDIVKAAAIFEKDAKLLRTSLPVMQEIFAAALREKYNAAEENEFGTLPSELAFKLSRQSLLQLIEALDRMMNSVRMNANHNLMVTALCTSLRKAASK